MQEVGKQYAKIYHFQYLVTLNADVFNSIKEDTDLNFNSDIIPTLLTDFSKNGVFSVLDFKLFFCEMETPGYFV